MKLNTRTYLPGDFEAVENIWKETNMGGAIRGDDEQVILKTIKLGGQLIILEIGDPKEIIGTSWLTQDGRRVYLHHFAIKPKYQGNGYAKKLLNSSLNFARKTGLQIKLEVHQDNKIAQNLYKNGGFKYLGDYNVFIIRNFDEI